MLCDVQVAEAPAVVLFKNYDEPVMHYDGPWTESDLAAWAVQASRPALIEMDQ